MLKTSSIARGAVAAVALFAAAGAFAEGTFTPELGLGRGGGKQVGITGDRQTLTWSLGLGYEADNHFGARAVLVADGDIVRGAFASYRSFDNFVGAEATYAVPLRDSLKLVGGLGIGRTKLDDGQGGTSDSTTLTDGLLSGGLQYTFSRHYAMELRVIHLTTSGLTSATLMAQIPF